MYTKWFWLGLGFVMLLLLLSSCTPKVVSPVSTIDTAPTISCTESNVGEKQDGWTCTRFNVFKGGTPIYIWRRGL